MSTPAEIYKEKHKSDKILWNWFCEILAIPSASNVAKIEERVKTLRKAQDALGFVTEAREYFVWSESNTQYEQVTKEFFDAVMTLDPKKTVPKPTIPPITAAIRMWQKDAKRILDEIIKEQVSLPGENDRLDRYDG